ncbi:hypothetical protein Tcan_06604 [Toxocara canis]|uniref:Uncharacterized protein n=1 Tax=Toxocara canis TaxID=6265 RepID=A0A0B2VUE6_TOXCA|nr:hypothetical protein Tcan_06604 [Toxocara canis]
MVAFTAAKLPDTEIEMMNLALDRAENMEMLTPAKKPNHNYMSAVEEFLFEIGADVEAGARKLEEEMEEITQKWRWITGGTILIILLIMQNSKKSLDRIFGKALRKMTSQHQLFGVRAFLQMKWVFAERGSLSTDMRAQRRIMMPSS